VARRQPAPRREDLLGAGAILDALGLPLSPEARVARNAFRAPVPDLAVILRACISGQELIDRGFGEDVEFAAALNANLLDSGCYRGEILLLRHRGVG
jgi:2-phosphosulfolactate phosphatase